MKRVLITGATGFIGKALAVEGLARALPVFGIASNSGRGGAPPGLAGEAALRLPDDGLLRVIEQFQPDVIFHCAGSALPALSFSSPSRDFRCSAPVVQDLLESARQAAPRAHLVLLSSAAVYGQAASLPISEKTAPSPVSPYGFHKWIGEILSREYAQVYGLRISSARVFSAYGPHLTKQVVWDSICKLAKPGLAEFPGTGEESRDFIFINDLVDALYRIADREDEGHQVINVASGEETRIAEVVGTVARYMGVSEGRWRFTGQTASAAPPHWRADISELRSLGFETTVSFEEGVRRTVEWSRSR